MTLLHLKMELRTKQQKQTCQCFYLQQQNKRLEQGIRDMYKGAMVYMTNRRPGSGRLHNAGAAKSQSLPSGLRQEFTFAYQWQKY